MHISIIYILSDRFPITMRLPKENEYPTSIKIGRKYWKVVFHPDLDDLGECDGFTRTIFIRSGLSKREALKTLIHEVLHAFESEYSLDIKHSMVYSLERAIFAVLRDNF